MQCFVKVSVRCEFRNLCVQHFFIKDVFAIVYRYVIVHTDWKDEADKLKGDDAVDFMVQVVQRFHELQEEKEQEKRKPICLSKL